MRNHAVVPRKQLRTSNYNAEARARLGVAVEEARIAAGYKFRTDFCRAHNIKNLRGLELLEQGKTGVGQAFLFEVADALPNWSRETPAIVLEGGDPPPVNPLPPPNPDSIPTGWSEEEEQRWLVARETLEALKIKAGLTRQQWRYMRDEYEQLEALDRLRHGHITPGGQS